MVYFSLHGLIYFCLAIAFIVAHEMRYLSLFSISDFVQTLDLIQTDCLLPPMGRSY